jgi:hypothetical protein
MKYLAGMITCMIGFINFENELKLRETEVNPRFLTKALTF